MSFRCPFLLLLIASCTTKEVAPKSADPAPTPKTPAAHAPFGEPEEDAPWPLSEEAEQNAKLGQTAHAMDRVLCPDSPCCVTEIQEAGRDRKGQELFVVALGGDGPCLAPPPPPPPGPFGAGLLDRARAPGRRAKMRAEAAERARADQAESEDENGGYHECEPANYHFVTRKGGRIRDVALVTSICGAPADFPEPGNSVAADKEKKTVTEMGGSGNNLWSDYSITVGLDPLRMLSIQSSSFYRTRNNDSTARSWDWDTFTGTSQWAVNDCKKQEEQEAARRRRDAGSRNEDEEDAVYSIESVLIPEVQLPPDFVANGWRTTGLGSCSAPLNQSIFGDSGSSAAEVRVVISEWILYVEITDDRFVGPGKNWVKDDHLELWMGSAPDDRWCNAGQDKGRMAQWGIRVADGEVFAAHGSPVPLTGIERVVSKRKARFKIPLPRMGDRITVVYSDSDDGKRQKQLVGTSQLRFGDPWTMGESFGTGCGCIVKKGVLQPKCDPLVPEEGKALMEGWL